MFTRLVSFLILAFVALVFVGCIIGPSIRLYKPITDWEKEAFLKAEREIYPNDVRDDFPKYDSARVAWPGIILGAETSDIDTSIIIQFKIEHHYYDWIEDFSIQQEKIFLSPRGEGLFETKWHLKPGSDITKVNESIGDMIIVYGIPKDIKDSTIVLDAYYVRVIEKQWFSTQFFNYGRPGDSMTILRVP